MFDWERFSVGCPIIDLAPLVQGMGTIEQLSRVLEHYSRSNLAALPADPLKQLIIAKTWIVIEVTNILTRNRHAQLEMYISWYQANLPKWLQQVKHLL